MGHSPALRELQSNGGGETGPRKCSAGAVGSEEAKFHTEERGQEGWWEQLTCNPGSKDGWIGDSPCG